MTVIRHLKTQQERKTERRSHGPLRNLIVSDTTYSRYLHACQLFFQHQLAIQRRYDLHAFELDLELCAYIETLWESGDPRGYATDCLSGLQHFCPQLRQRLPGAWRLVSAWQKHELPCRATPASADVTLAWAGALTLRGAPWAALATMLGFHCLLRTGELAAIQCKDFVVGSHAIILHLPHTKSGQRFGCTESVVIDDPGLIKLVTCFVQQHQPGDVLCPSPALFRTLFNQAVADVRLPDMPWKPYSLRRGGATALFKQSGSLDATCVRGRWANMRTCRIYINDALQELAAVRITPAQRQRLQTFGNAIRAALPGKAALDNDKAAAVVPSSRCS